MNKKTGSIIILSLAILLCLSACSPIKHTVKPTTTVTKSKSKKTVKKIKKVDKYHRIIKKMTLNEKIGQLYFAHSTGDFKQMKHDVKKYHLGGITLFANDFLNRSNQQFLQEMKSYQAASKHGLFIATDQEGGTVSRLNSNSKIISRTFPSPQTIYQKYGLRSVINEDRDVAKILREKDINMNFAPVADVSHDKNSFIYNRTLGKNYQTTAEYIYQAVNAIQSQKVAATLKHFPGYGDASDTHTGFAAINKSLTQYKKEDLIPFEAGIKAGVDGIMVSHIVINTLDTTYPASLSPRVHQLLRKQLHYSGLIISDDLQMGAITQFAQKHVANADVLALKAGNDLLLGGDYKTGIKLIKKAIKNGQISEKQIDQSLYRILKIKDKLSVLK